MPEQEQWLKPESRNGLVLMQAASLFSNTKRWAANISHEPKQVV